MLEKKNKIFEIERKILRNIRGPNFDRNEWKMCANGEFTQEQNQSITQVGKMFPWEHISFKREAIDSKTNLDIHNNLDFLWLNIRNEIQNATTKYY